MSRCSLLGASIAELPTVATAWLLGFLIWNSFGHSAWHLVVWAVIDGYLWLGVGPVWSQPVLWLILLGFLTLVFGFAMRVQIARHEMRYLLWAFLVYLAANGLVITTLTTLQQKALAALGLAAPVWVMQLSLPNGTWIVNQILPCLLAILTFLSLLPRIRRRATAAFTQADTGPTEEPSAGDNPG